MLWFWGDLLDRLNGKKYKTGRGLPRPSLMEVMRAYERDLGYEIEKEEKKSDDRN